MVGVLSREAALALAEESGMDLVEIQPTADPPVCRIMDYGKFKFEAQKKANAAKQAAEEALKNAKGELDIATAQAELAVMAAQIAALRKYRQKH